MAIDVACKCGRISRAKDHLAGKRAKCPACGNIVTVPSPPNDAELAAAQLLLENDGPATSPAEKAIGSPDPKPATAPVAEAREKNVNSLQQSPRPASDGKASGQPRKKIKINYKARESSGGPIRIFISPGVMAALGSIIGGGIWMAVLVANNRIAIYPMIVMMLGVLRLVRGFMGFEEE
jgi:hypothetical protein